MFCHQVFCLGIVLTRVQTWKKAETSWETPSFVLFCLLSFFWSRILGCVLFFLFSIKHSWLIVYSNKLLKHCFFFSIIPKKLTTGQIIIPPFSNVYPGYLSGYDGSVCMIRLLFNLIHTLIVSHFWSYWNCHFLDQAKVPIWPESFSKQKALNVSQHRWSLQWFAPFSFTFFCSCLHQVIDNADHWPHVLERENSYRKREREMGVPKLVFLSCFLSLSSSFVATSLVDYGTFVDTLQCCCFLL